MSSIITHNGPPQLADAHLRPNFSLSTVFSQDIQDFSLAYERTRGKFATKGENSLAALKQPCQRHRAALRSTEHCAQASC